MEVLFENDIYVNALKKVNMNESAMPVHNGRVLVENVEAYAKIEKLLACDKMQNCHRWLYDLDVENLSEGELSRIDSLYNLGLNNGLIDVDDCGCDCDLPVQDELEQIPVEDPVVPAPQPKVPISSYVAMYSAVNPAGQIKTGEAYSNAINPTAAKADILNKLEKAGYHSIEILCIEVGDSSFAGMPEPAEPAVESEEDQTNEADDKEPLSHAFDEIGVKASTANTIGQDEVKMNIIEKDDEDEEDSNESVSIGKDAIGRPVLEKDDSSDDAEEKSEDKSDDEKSEDKSDDEKTDDKAEDTKEEKAEEPDEKLKDDATDDASEDKDDEKSDDKDDLSDAEKTQLRDSYKKAFKAAMLKCKFIDMSFDDLSLEQKIEFFTQLNDAWKKADPSKFMTAKETEALEKVVVTK